MFRFGYSFNRTSGYGVLMTLPAWSTIKVGWRGWSTRQMGVQKRIEEERPHLQPLPAHKAADYTELWVRVTSSSTINVRLMVYSVP
jgi:hypothetical protein